MFFQKKIKNEKELKEIVLEFVTASAKSKLAYET
jgi:hypothetical protein